MKNRKNPFPNVTRTVDRHNKVRWRYRSKGFSTYLVGSYGSAEFRASYEQAINNKSTTKEYNVLAYGTLHWLIEQYLRSPKHLSKSTSTKKVLLRELDWLRKEAGDLPLSEFRARHIEALMSRKSGPAAANKVRKNLSMLFTFAIKQEVDGVTNNPTKAADRKRESSEGFHTWTNDEMKRFLATHPAGSKARLVFRIAENTGAARSDICKMTWENIKGDRIFYKRGKTEVGGGYIIQNELATELAKLDPNIPYLVSHSGGLPYKPETFGNWFKAQCMKAGLEHCSLHGIRKGQATAIADSGGSEFEVMAFLAHASPKEAATYTRKANRNKLADSGLSRLARAKT